MNKSLQTILLVLLFAVSAALGYYLAGFAARPGNEETSLPGEEVREPAAAAASGKPRIVDIETPSYKAATGLYLFRASAVGNNVTFHLTDRNKKILHQYDQRTSDAVFEVPPTATGQYYLYVEDAAGQFSEMHLISGCVQPKAASVKKVSEGELSALLNGKDAKAARQALEGRIAPGCRYLCTGLNTENSEENPSSYVEIINRLKRSWESISISGIQYDSQGRISSVSIQVKQKQQ